MANMDDHDIRERRRLGMEFDATLTPKQRELLAIGASSAVQWTPKQLEIMKELQPYLDGMTLEQQQKLGAMDVFQDGYEAGQAVGGKLGILIAVLVVALVILLLISHC